MYTYMYVRTYVWTMASVRVFFGGGGGTRPLSAVMSALVDSIIPPVQSIYILDVGTGGAYGCCSGYTSIVEAQKTRT